MFRSSSVPRGLTEAHRIILYSRLQVREGFCYTHITRCLAAKWPISLWSQSSTFAQSSLASCSCVGLSHCWCGRCRPDCLARKQPKAGHLASAKATVSGVGALFFSCKATLSSPTASIPTTASYLPHASSCTHQPLKPSLSPTVGTKYQILCNPCLSRCRQSLLNWS